MTRLSRPEADLDRSTATPARHCDAVAEAAPFEATGDGPCSECGCPAYQGGGTYCTRSACGHHWKSHASTVV